MQKVWFAVGVFVVLTLAIVFQHPNVFATMENRKEGLSSGQLRSLERLQQPGANFPSVLDETPAKHLKPDVPPKQPQANSTLEMLNEAFEEANREALLQKVYEKSWKAWGKYKAKKKEARLRRLRGESFEAEEAEREAKKLEQEYADAEAAAEERTRELYEEWGTPWSGPPQGVWPSEDYVPPADDYGA